MKADILSLDGKKVKSVELPGQFDEEYRPDLIRRAVLSVQSRTRQKYGAKKGAGMRHAAKVSRRRRKYRGSYGKGISRVPRKVMSHRGSQFNWVGANVSGMVGGRRAHPPKAEKEWGQKINIKERRKAIRSAIAATALKDVVVKRGHKAEHVPLVIESRFEDLKKTQEVEGVLNSIGLAREMERTKEKKVRAGKGKARGRKYKRKIGPLLVVSKKCPLSSSAINIEGVDTVVVDSLNAEVLAPGTEPGRLTVWTEKALERLEKEKLFTGAKAAKEGKSK